MSDHFVTEAGNTILREPTKIERELAEQLIRTFVDPHQISSKRRFGEHVDVDLVALTLSNILVNVCDYTPGEETVAQFIERHAHSETPATAEQGIRAFVAVLKRHWGRTGLAEMNDRLIDECVKAALKGEL